MAGRAAARLMDATAHGNPLAPGPCSHNVFIGKKPAWRGLPLAQVAQLLDTVTKLAEATARVAASPVPNMKDIKAVEDYTQKIASTMAMVDQHACAVVKPVPDGNGVVINGSQTVLINNLPACRMGDTIQEVTNVNKIIAGEFTVLIGS